MLIGMHTMEKQCIKSSHDYTEHHRQFLFIYWCSDGRTWFDCDFTVDDGDAIYSMDKNIMMIFCEDLRIKQ